MDIDRDTIEVLAAAAGSERARLLRRAEDKAAASINATRNAAASRADGQDRIADTLDRHAASCREEEELCRAWVLSLDSAILTLRAATRAAV